MLSTDSIRNKILEDARKSATQILSDADVRAQKNRAASDKRIADARAKAMSDAQAQGDEMRDRMLRMAELDMRKELLGSKREVISEAFQKALERMRTMDVATAREFARKRTDSQRVRHRDGCVLQGRRAHIHARVYRKR